MNPQNLSMAAAILIVTALHAFVPQLASPIVTCVLGGLGLAAAFLIARPKDAAWIQELEAEIQQLEGGTQALARLNLKRSSKFGSFPTALLLMTKAFFIAGIISSIALAVHGAALLVMGCSSVSAIVQNGGNCIADILAATQGTEDPMRIISDCGTTLDVLITAIENQLNPPDAGATALDPAQRARLERILARAKALKAQRSM